MSEGYYAESVLIEDENKTFEEIKALNNFKRAGYHMLIDGIVEANTKHLCRQLKEWRLIAVIEFILIVGYFILTRFA